MKAPIKYFGGKGGMYNKIIEHFPLPSEYDTYIEPFGGSFSVGLNKPIASVEIYNDLEQNVYSLFKVLSDKSLFDEFKEKCDLLLYSEDIRREFIENLKKDNISTIERAICFFYVNRTSRNGIGGFSINQVVRRGMSKSISDYLSTVDNLKGLHERLSRIIISNQDGIKLIEKNSRPRTLIYCDPPYEQDTRTKVRYKCDMNRNSHLEFIEVAIQSKSKIIISGYNHEIYDKLTENGFTKISFEVKTVNTSNKPKTKIETLWKNY